MEHSRDVAEGYVWDVGYVNPSSTDTQKSCKDPETKPLERKGGLPLSRSRSHEPFGVPIESVAVPAP
jgi:hypothetical protein